MIRCAGTRGRITILDRGIFAFGGRITFLGDGRGFAQGNNRLDRYRLGRFAVLEWNPRLFALLALVALLVIALAGGWSDLFSPPGYYWEW
jgi:hypothetical protein